MIFLSFKINTLKNGKHLNFLDSLYEWRESASIGELFLFESWYFFYMIGIIFSGDKKYIDL